MGRWHSRTSMLRIVVSLSILLLMTSCTTMQEKGAGTAAMAPATAPRPTQTVETPAPVPDIPTAPVAKAPDPLPPGVPSIWPVLDDSRIILSSYGYRGGRRGGPGAFHRAVDIKTPMNAPVVAAANGIVKQKSNGGDYGKMIVLDHQNGFQSVYAHLNEFKAEPGQQVAKGDVIGLAGRTGNATCPHVHYEVRKNEEAVNPAIFLPMKETHIEKLATLVPVTATSTAANAAPAKPVRTQLAKVDDDQYGVPVDHQVKNKSKTSHKKNTRKTATSKSALTPSKAIVGSAATKKETGLTKATSAVKTQETEAPLKVTTKSNDNNKKTVKLKKSDVNKAATTKIGKSTHKTTAKKTVKKSSTAKK